MRPRARLISLIGDELISDEPVAVVELVKNAYDADASKVDVSFQGEDSGNVHTVVIEDDGVGMTLNDVLEGWFEPGTIMKKRHERSPGGRLYQGAKGIGRFAAARLAESLFLETKKPGEPEGVSVLLEWGKFDDDSFLDDIEIHYETVPLPDLKHGTRLSLADLREPGHWTEEAFRTLHTRLSRLISPFQSAAGESEIPDFEIDLQIPGYPSLTGRVQPHELTSKPRYRLSGRISADGTFSGTVEVKGKKRKNRKSIGPTRLGSEGEQVRCGAFEVEIRAWDRDRPGLAPYMIQFDQTLTGIRRILDEYCGVSVYRDGFRVHPYGEQGNDWLSLDTRSRQNPTRCLANNQIIASVRISRGDNPGLKDRTTREGMVHNEDYHALTDWFRRVLALLENERYRVRPREETKSQTASTLYEPFDMSDVVEHVDEELGKGHPVSRLVKQKDEDIQGGIKRLQEHYSRVLLAAGLGQLVDVVIHEIGAPLGRATREVAYLRKQLTQKLDSAALDKLLGAGASEKLEETFTRIRAWLEQISAMRERLVPKAAGRRSRSTNFSVQEEIEDNLALYDNLLAKQKISPVVRASAEPLMVHMPRSALGQVVANLLDNSVYWVTQHHGERKGGEIEIQLTRLKHGFRIRVSDDGPGVAEEDQEFIFDQEFSRKPNGMGLGLFVARQVIEPYGRLLYDDDGKLPGACFEASFEKGVGL